MRTPRAARVGIRMPGAGAVRCVAGCWPRPRAARARGFWALLLLRTSATQSMRSAMSVECDGCTCCSRCRAAELIVGARSLKEELSYS